MSSSDDSATTGFPMAGGLPPQGVIMESLQLKCSSAVAPGVPMITYGVPEAIDRPSKER